MKAVVWTDYGRIEIQDVPVPSAGPLEVLVKVKACSLCTTDTVMIDRGIFGITPPRIIGHEVSGVVEAAGRGVTSLTRGDRVALEPPVPCRKCETCSSGLTHLCPHTLHIGAHTPGGMAEFVAIDHRNAHRVPERLSFQEAALTEPVAVCLEALDRAGGVRGRTVALFGDGPFSMIFTKLAVLSGATKVLAIGHHEARLRKLQRYGAVPINSLTVNPVIAVKESTAGFGADVIIDNNPIPIINGRNADSTLTVRDGDTIMMGGFITENRSRDKSGVPFLKDIPGLGALFRSRNDSNNRTELIVLMRARVLRSPEEAAIIAAQEKNDLPGLRQAEQELKQANDKRKKKAANPDR